MSRVLAQLRSVGQDVMDCTLACDGIAMDRNAGIRPRGPLLENVDASGARGALIVGLNPGRADVAEREVLRDARSPEPWAEWCERELLGRNHYVQRLRRIAAALEVNGPLVWSNVAKCECPVGQRAVPLETQRSCAQRFLTRELAIVPPDWPVCQRRLKLHTSTD